MHFSVELCSHQNSDSQVVWNRNEMCYSELMLYIEHFHYCWLWMIKRRYLSGWVVAHTCNPSTLGGWGRRITRSRDRDQDHPGQHGETMSLLKLENELGVVVHACSPNYSGGWGRIITWTQEAEVTVKQDGAIAFQPGDRDSVKKKKKKEKYAIFILKYFANIFGPTPFSLQGFCWDICCESDGLSFVGDGPFTLAALRIFSFIST